MFKAISRSYNDDKRISAKEARVKRKKLADLKKITEGFVRACESGRFERKQRKG